jgi:hypothetical protein
MPRTGYRITKRPKDKALIEKLVDICGIPFDIIHLMSPYNGQLHLHQEIMDLKKYPIRISTINSSSGTESPVVIIDWSV